MAIYQNLQVWLLLSALTAAPIAAQPNLDWSTVSGQVLDAHGRPVSEATISAFPLDVAISGPMPQGTISDESGRYKLSLPPFTGRTRLSAAKPRDGYPDAQGLLFATGEEKMPIIHLAPRAKLDHVDICPRSARRYLGGAGCRQGDPHPYPERTHHTAPRIPRIHILRIAAAGGHLRFRAATSASRTLSLSPGLHPMEILGQQGWRTLADPQQFRPHSSYSRAFTVGEGLGQSFALII